MEHRAHFDNGIKKKKTMNSFIISTVLLATFYLASGAPAPEKGVALKVPEIKPIGSSSEDQQQKPEDVQPQTKPDSEDGLGEEEVKEDEEKTENNGNIQCNFKILYTMQLSTKSIIIRHNEVLQHLRKNSRSFYA